MSASLRVATLLERRVVDELAPGDRLPAESELAADYAVSRATVREALRTLSGRGLVSTAKGRRAVVRGPDPALLSSHLLVAVARTPSAALELMGVRRALDVQAASLAAGQSGRAALFGISAAFQAMAEAVGQQAGSTAYLQADLAFHAAVGLASGNTMLGLLLQAVTDALALSSGQGCGAAGGDDLAADLDAHRQILEAIRSRDAAGAAKATSVHLLAVEHTLRRAVTLPSTSPATH